MSQYSSQGLCRGHAFLLKLLSFFNKRQGKSQILIVGCQSLVDAKG